MVPVKIEIPIPFFLTELDKSKIHSRSSSSVKKNGMGISNFTSTILSHPIKKHKYQNSCLTNGTDQ